MLHGPVKLFLDAERKIFSKKLCWLFVDLRERVFPCGKALFLMSGKLAKISPKPEAVFNKEYVVFNAAVCLSAKYRWFYFLIIKRRHFAYELF